MVGNKEKGAPFSPSTGSLRFNLSPASFTQLPSSILIFILGAFGWMSRQLIEILLHPVSGLKKALFLFLFNNHCCILITFRSTKYISLHKEINTLVISNYINNIYRGRERERERKWEEVKKLGRRLHQGLKGERVRNSWGDLKPKRSQPREAHTLLGGRKMALYSWRKRQMTRQYY